MSEPYAYIRRQFDLHAHGYLRNPITHWVGQSELAAFKSMILPPKQTGETEALDFGCGTGRMTSLLLDMGYKVTGYDLSPAMLERAQAALGERQGVSFTSDPTTLTREWSLIVALGVLDYYTDSIPLWNEWKRLLTRDGILLVTVPNARSPLAKLYTFFSRFTCQAYASTLEALTPYAQAAGFTSFDRKFAFPQQTWGHTIVLGFRLDH